MVVKSDLQFIKILDLVMSERKIPKAVKVVERGRAKIGDVEVNYVVLDEDYLLKYKLLILKDFENEFENLLNTLQELYRVLPDGKLAKLIEEIENLPVLFESLLDKEDDEDVVIDRVEDELLRIRDVLDELLDEKPTNNTVRKLIREVNGAVDDLLRLLNWELREDIHFCIIRNVETFEECDLECSEKMEQECLDDCYLDCERDYKGYPKKLEWCKAECDLYCAGSYKRENYEEYVKCVRKCIENKGGKLKVEEKSILEYIT